jgi:hypothetical protein
MVATGTGSVLRSAAQTEGGSVWDLLLVRGVARGIALSSSP